MTRILAALAAFVAVAALTGCTPEEQQRWLEWHAVDPAAALASLEQSPADPPSPGDCSSYAPLFEQYGLPVATFKRIAWRESGCNHRSFVIDSDDAGGGLLGLNLKGSLARGWNSWCGLNLGNVRDAETNVRCAAVAYQKLGMRPWG
jgi:hypothetical protein